MEFSDGPMTLFQQQEQSSFPAHSKDDSLRYRIVGSCSGASASEVMVRSCHWSGIKSPHVSSGVESFRGSLVAVYHQEGPRDSGSRQDPKAALTIYDPANNTWESVPPIRLQDVDHDRDSDPGNYWEEVDIPYNSGIIALNQKLYVIGGSKDPLGALESKKEVFSLDMSSISSREEGTQLINLQWNRCADMITARDWFASVAMNEKIYVFGGCGGMDNNMFMGKAEVYDPAEDFWFPIASCGEGMSDRTAFSFEGNIWLCGGFDMENSDSDEETSENSAMVSYSFGDMYFPSEDIWEGGIDWDGEPDGQVAVVKGNVYNVQENSIYVYDRFLGLWALFQVVSWEYVQRQIGAAIENIYPYDSMVVLDDHELLAMVRWKDTHASGGLRNRESLVRSSGLGCIGRSLVWSVVESKIFFNDGPESLLKSVNRLCVVERGRGK